MTQPNRQTRNRQSILKSCLLYLFSVLALLVFLSFSLYDPDPPVETIVPGTSSEPTFVVQLIQPRSALPLAGLIPPAVFGKESSLRFGSDSPDANVSNADKQRLEIRAKGWNVVLAMDDKGQVSPDSYVETSLVFQGNERLVRCRPGETAKGSFSVIELTSGELSGSFEIELPHCEDAQSGIKLNWPPEPLVLHGSFDRLPNTQSELQ